MKIFYKTLKINFFKYDTKQISPLEWRQGLTVFFALVLATSMTFSPFLLSASMWGLVACSLWQSALITRATGRVRSTRSAGAWAVILLDSFRRLFRQPALGLLCLLFVAALVSGLWSEDHRYWLERTRIRVPFVVLPWVFANLPPLERRHFQLVLYVLVWTLVALCLGIGLHFLLHFDAIMADMSRGQPVPVPRHHIRFNLILVTGILAGGWLWLEKFVVRWAWERRALAIGVVFLFGFIHVLSVRSGLLALYTALIFSLFRFIWHSKRWASGLFFLLALCLAPYLAFRALPSLQMRAAYMKYDLEQYRLGQGGKYSDSGRFVSLETGWRIWKENPWLGTGMGDLPAATREMLQRDYPGYTETPKLPHNQFLYILASSGLFGLILSLPGLLYPLFLRRYRQNGLFMAFEVVAFASFLAEYTLETSIGAAFYLFFHLWFMRITKTTPNHC